MKGLNLDRNIEPIPETDISIPDFLKTEEKDKKHFSPARKTASLSRFPLKKGIGIPRAAQQWENLLHAVKAKKDKEKRQEHQSDDLNNDPYGSQNISETDSVRGSEISSMRLPPTSPLDTDSVASVPITVSREVSLDGARLRRTVSNPPEATCGLSTLNNAPIASPEQSDTEHQLSHRHVSAMTPIGTAKKVSFWKTGEEGSPSIKEEQDCESNGASAASGNIGLKRRGYGPGHSSDQEEESSS